MILRAFTETFPTETKPRECPAKEKKYSQKKKQQRKQEGEKAKGKNLGGQCQNVPQNVPSVHSKSPEALASGTGSNIYSSQLKNILGSLSSFWPKRDHKMAGLLSKVVFCPDWVSTYENNGLTSCKRTPSGLGISWRCSQLVEGMLNEGTMPLLDHKAPFD